jgi:transcriptional regulator with XRE-family HTH domain
MEHRELWRPDGRLIAELRRQRGWSRVRLAQAAGVSHHTVAKAERGEAVFPTTLGEVAAALGLTAEAIRVRAEAAPSVGAAHRNLCDALRDRYELYQAAIRGGGFDLMRREFPKGVSRSALWTFAGTRDLSKVGVYEGTGGVIRFFERVFTDYRLGEHRVEEIVPVGRRALLARGVESFSAAGLGDVVGVWMHLSEFDRRGRLVACRLSADVRPVGRKAGPVGQAGRSESGIRSPL